MQGPNGNTDKFNSIKIKIPHGKKHCMFKKKKEHPWENMSAIHIT